MYTVDIDTGGTMTDALVSDGLRRHSIKVDTTPHDYTVSFLACLAEAAKQLGHADVEGFLDRVQLIRWSSTITTNVLAERRGSKVGMLVSKGHESDLYGAGRSPVIGELIDPQSIIGLSAAPDAGEILSAVKKLLETGVRRICVTLEHAFPDNSAEVAIKRVIENQYPDHILGSVPVLLGSDMAQTAHDQTRAHYSLMNAYTHSQLATSLFKAEDLLRDEHRWNGPLLIGHTSGGVARIGKTKAVDTIESGPVFGTFGGAYMAREYGLNSVICFDVGGTTTKASVLRDGAPVFQRGGELMEIPVKASFAMLRSAAIGGGSVARVRNGVLTLGPESMGAAPGPACYGLGGNAATLTDALLCLGYLDPGLFMGGRRKLDAAHALAIIDKNIARPLDVSVEVAALAIRDEAVEMMAELVAAIATEAALPLRDTALFAFGGNGPVFGAFLADKLGLADVYAFDLGPVFSAFGSAVSDVVHVYERGAGLKWQHGAKPAILGLAANLYRQAARDLSGEGFSVESASHCFELEFGGDGDIAGKVRIEARGEPGDAWFTAAAAAAAQQGIDLARYPMLLLRLSSRLAVGEAAQPKQARTVQKAEATKRPMRFNGSTAMLCPAHRWENLSSGDSISGPATINGATLTCPIPPNWKLEVDGYGNAHLMRYAK